METLMSVWHALLETGMSAWNVVKVALGLGFVIFLHELGHFLLAKWNGVKVEKFSIGFGPTLASFRRGVGLRVGSGSRPPGPEDPPTWGETEYILAALPLGGYVKMLGESQDDASGDPEASSNPRAYHNKSVWARMQIITAGVIMNVLLGVVCFAFVASQGGVEQPAKVGGVLPGSPAYKAGLRAGDEIVAIDGQRDVAFKHLLSRVSLSAAGQKIRFSVKRLGSAKEEDLVIEPARDNGTSMPVIGMHPASNLELDPEIPFRASPGMEVGKTPPFDGVKGGLVVAVGLEGGPLEPVADYDAFIARIEPLRDRPIVLEVERKDPEASPGAAPSRVKVTVPVHKFVDFGLRMTSGPVAAVRADSPAMKAGVKEGDRIVAVGGDRDFDPMHLPDLARAAAGKPLTLTVERGAEGKPAETVELTATPDESPIWVESVDPHLRVTPLDVPGLGLAFWVEAKVRAVKEGSPASAAGIKPGESLRSMTVTPAKLGKSKPRPDTFKFEPGSKAWTLAFAYLQEVPWTSVEVSVEGREKPLALSPVADQSWSHPLRGLRFEALTRTAPPMGLADSLSQGIEETKENIKNVFLIFQSLAQGRVGANALGGVIPIANIAYTTASSGWTPFIHFLGILSVNLAVLNFLPIPPLDGGQFAFLTAEKVRGKPLPDSFLNFVTIGGVVFVLLLIVFINGKDLVQLIQSYL